MTALKKILWADAIAGGSTGIAGLVLSEVLVEFLGLPHSLIVIIATVTFVYALFAFYLARTNQPRITQVKVLIYTNWVWTALQIIVVGLLAWLEGRQANPTH